jgi:hypothetical protein
LSLFARPESNELPSFRQYSKSSDSSKRAYIKTALQHARDLIKRRVDASRVISMARRGTDC